MSCEYRNDRAHHLVLDGEKIPVVTVSPRVSAGRSVDELRPNAHPIAASPGATPQQVTCPQFAANLTDIYRLIPVLQNRIPRDD
jgi:hypothetical protein